MHDSRRHTQRPTLLWRWPATSRRGGPLEHPRILLALFVLAALVALLVVAASARALGI